MKRYRYWEKHLGRFGFFSHPYAINRPMVSARADGDAQMIVLSYGTPGADPVLMLDIDVSGTKIGKLISDVDWWFYQRRRAREHS